MKFDERCDKFVNEIVSEQSEERGGDDSYTARYSCGCSHVIINENTPGFRCHDNFWTCLDCKLKQK